MLIYISCLLSAVFVSATDELYGTRAKLEVEADGGSRISLRHIVCIPPVAPRDTMASAETLIKKLLTNTLVFMFLLVCCLSAIPTARPGGCRVFTSCQHWLVTGNLSNYWKVSLCRPNVGNSFLGLIIMIWEKEWPSSWRPGPCTVVGSKPGWRSLLTMDRVLNIISVREVYWRGREDGEPPSQKTVPEISESFNTSLINDWEVSYKTYFLTPQLFKITLFRSQKKFSRNKIWRDSETERVWILGNQPFIFCFELSLCPSARRGDVRWQKICHEILEVSLMPKVNPR